MNRPLPGKDVPPFVRTKPGRRRTGRPRPARAGRSGALTLQAFLEAAMLDNTEPQTVRLWPDGDAPAGHPYLDTVPSHLDSPRLAYIFRG